MSKKDQNKSTVLLEFIQLRCLTAGLKALKIAIFRCINRTSTKIEKKLIYFLILDQNNKKMRLLHFVAKM